MGLPICYQVYTYFTRGLELFLRVHFVCITELLRDVTYHKIKTVGRVAPVLFQVPL